MLSIGEFLDWLISEEGELIHALASDRIVLCDSVYCLYRESYSVGIEIIVCRANHLDRMIAYTALLTILLSVHELHLQQLPTIRACVVLLII